MKAANLDAVFDFLFTGEDPQQVENEGGQQRPPHFLIAGKARVYLYRPNSNNPQGYDKEEYFGKYRIPGPSVLSVELTASAEEASHDRFQAPKKPVIRILDASILVGDYIGALPYEKRLECIKKFCKAAALVSGSVSVQTPKQQQNFNKNRLFVKLEPIVFHPMELVVAECFKLSEIPLHRPVLTKHQNEPVAFIREGQNAFRVSGLHVLKYLNDQWSVFWSNTAKQCYAYSVVKQPGGGHKAASVFPDKYAENQVTTNFYDTAFTKNRPHMHQFWSWQNSRGSSVSAYGVKSIMKNDSHQDGPTLKSVAATIQPFTAPRPVKSP
ncbi:unnamed protein product, partial [Mesorhabditis spiculigera]